MAAADDGHVLTGSSDKTVKVWRGDELVRTIEAHTRGHAVAVLPGGARFISGSRDDREAVHLRRRARAHLRGGQLRVSVAALPDGVHFVVGTNEREVRLYHVDGTLVHTFKGHTRRCTRWR